MENSNAGQGQSASELISNRIAELGGWREATLGRMRTLIKQADPEVVEEWKWVKATNPGTPVWSHDGIICTGESYKDAVKLTFAKGASLTDPARLFNASLEGNLRRAIDIHEGEEVDADAFTALVREAVALNTAGASKPAPKAATKATKKAVKKASKQAAKTTSKKAAKTASKAAKASKASTASKASKTASKAAKKALKKTATKAAKKASKTSSKRASKASSKKAKS
jgi:hypothetical protein